MINVEKGKLRKNDRCRDLFRRKRIKLVKHLQLYFVYHLINPKHYEKYFCVYSITTGLGFHDRVCLVARIEKSA